MPRALLFTLVFLALPACDPNVEAPSRSRTAISAQPVSQIDTDPPAVAIDLGQPDHRGWRRWLTTALADLTREAPDFVADLSSMKPDRTRAGTLRFTDRRIAQPAALPVLLRRLVDGHEDPEVRVALADAIPRTMGPFGPAAVELTRGDHQVGVRTTLVASLRRVPGDLALPALENALRDPEALVRAEAARTIGRHPQGTRLAPSLLRVVRDPDPQVRQDAARTLGAFRYAPAKIVLSGLLTDAAPDVRLQALHALERIDPAYVASLPQLDALRRDSDPRVSRAASQLTDR